MITTNNNPNQAGLGIKFYFRHALIWISTRVLNAGYLIFILIVTALLCCFVLPVKMMENMASNAAEESEL